MMSFHYASTVMLWYHYVMLPDVHSIMMALHYDILITFCMKSLHKVNVNVWHYDIIMLG